MTNNRLRGIRVLCPTFDAYTILNGGHLPDRQACHALFYYYLRASYNYEKQQNAVVLEGEPDPVFNFKNLYNGVALWYGVSPEEMNAFWNAVDRQVLAMGLPLLPHFLRFFGNEIITE